MGDPTESDLTALRDDGIDEVSAELSRRGLSAPAAILLDAHRPFQPVLRQAGLFLAPFIGPFLGRRRLDLLDAATTDPEIYDRLTARLAGDRPGRRPPSGEGEP